MGYGDRDKTGGLWDKHRHAARLVELVRTQHFEELQVKHKHKARGIGGEPPAFFVGCL